jgi:hypothetical protein
MQGIGIGAGVREKTCAGISSGTESCSSFCSSTRAAGGISSISNSSHRLLIRSILVFAALLAAYNLVLRSYPAAARFQNQEGKNVSVAEDYILDEKSNDIVIVGSSMSARFDPDALGPRFTNLSLSGGSAATGLEIIRRRGRPPRVVLIEINRLAELDSSFVENRFDPITLFFKKHLPSARVRNQPINLLLGFLKQGTRKDSSEADPKNYANLLAARREIFRQVSDESAVRNSIPRLTEAVDSLSVLGVVVVFFRMPVHRDLADSPKMKALAKEYHEAFPVPRYLWLDTIAGEFPTLDGVHLVGRGAVRFSSLFRREVEARFP